MKYLLDTNPCIVYLNGRSNSLIGAHDLLIASIAVVNDLILVTHNTREFKRVPNLIVEDWKVEA